MRGALIAGLASLLLAGCPSNGNYYGPGNGYYDQGSGYGGGYQGGYGGGGYQGGYGGGGYQGGNCSPEVDANGQRYLNCDTKVADNCSSERNNFGQRYWRCPQGGGGRPWGRPPRPGYGGYGAAPPPVEYTGVAPGCRWVAEPYGSGYYICSERQGGMSCDSERTNSGQRYYQCRP
ncbi:hypothetical protein [Zavarzinia sp. CC-PAN008]|uniref:hypothetical protein n=1 Tax=Zavarzinia sp. CC-PAN008 TaxID=3243332 RepID=UPI003F747C02